MKKTEPLILCIDCSAPETTVISLVREGTVVAKRDERRAPTEQVTLRVIDGLLRDTGTTVSDLAGIEVATGPGSFTGLKVGAAIGNALGWLLHIPVNGAIPPHDLPLVYEKSKW